MYTVDKYFKTSTIFPECDSDFLLTHTHIPTHAHTGQHAHARARVYLCTARVFGGVYVAVTWMYGVWSKKPLDRSLCSSQFSNPKPGNLMSPKICGTFEEYGLLLISINVSLHFCHTHARSLTRTHA